MKFKLYLVVALQSYILSQEMFQASLLSQDDHQQELDHRLANAETPPAVSNVELASSFIATMIGEQVTLIFFIFFSFRIPADVLLCFFM